VAREFINVAAFLLDPIVSEIEMLEYGEFPAMCLDELVNG